MVRPESKLLTGMLIDEEQELSLRELCRACGLHAEELIAMVEEGLLEPRGESPARWRFPATALRRVQIAIRLQRDLHVNLAGAAVAVDLIEELRRLRARLRCLENQFYE